MDSYRSGPDGVRFCRRAIRVLSAGTADSATHSLAAFLWPVDMVRHGAGCTWRNREYRFRMEPCALAWPPGSRRGWACPIIKACCCIRLPSCFTRPGDGYLSNIDSHLNEFIFI